MPENLKREKTFPFCGRLTVLENVMQRPLNDETWTLNREGLTMINFPAMPETIELARKSEYQVTTTPAFPDGVHQYKGTAPLEIPVSFVLHSFDREYCPKGALSLLQLAATLQSLVLPGGSDSVAVQVGPAPPRQKEGTGAAVLAGADADVQIVGQLPANAYNIYAPAAVFLELIVTEQKLPGIACAGYVRDVKTTLKGPWLRGQGISYNLPSSGEFSFLFIHHPGHGALYNYGKNQFAGQTEQQAFSGKVRQRLFNTRDLMTNAKA